MKDADPAASQPPLPPLPILPVVRSEYCSQEPTDKLVRFIHEARPDLIARLAQEEGINPTYYRITLSEYAKIFARITDEIREQSIIIEGAKLSRLGMIDFMYELSRRVRHQVGVRDLPPLGKPFKDVALDQPFPTPPFLSSRACLDNTRAVE